MNWTPCPKPSVGDVIRWKEPLWAKPTQKRGKPDQIGEQQITAKVVALGEVIELEVEDIDILSIDPDVEPPAGVKPGDKIKRKPTSIDRGGCERMK